VALDAGDALHIREQRAAAGGVAGGLLRELDVRLRIELLGLRLEEASLAGRRIGERELPAAAGVGAF